MSNKVNYGGGMRILGVHFSLGNSKMGMVPSFSMLPGPISKGGSCSEECVKYCYPDCYAKNHCLRGGKKTYSENQKIAISSPNIIAEAVNKFLSRASSGRFFRWFVSGDIIGAKFLHAMLSACMSVIEVAHLAFSKRFDIIEKYIKKILAVTNLSMILSGWRNMPIPKKLLKYFVFSWVDDGGDHYWETIRGKNYNFFYCPGNCDYCTFCWKVRRNENTDIILSKH